MSIAFAAAIAGVAQKQKGGAPAWPSSWAEVISVTRASVGTATTAAGAVTEFAADTARIVDGELVLGHATNVAWPYDEATITLATGTPDAAAAPDPTKLADQITATAHSGNASWSLTDLSIGEAYTFTLWVRYAAGDATWRLRRLTGEQTDFSATGTWTRHELTFTPSGSSATIQLIELGASNDASAYFWGAMCELRDHPTEIVPTSTAPAVGEPDDAVWASETQPAWIRDAFSIALRLYRASTETADESEETILAYSADDRIYVDSSNRVTVEIGGVVQIQTTALVWSRLQTITAVIDLAAGTITISGATSGDGVHTGTGSLSPATGAIQVGATPGVSLSSVARIRLGFPSEAGA